MTPQPFRVFHSVRARELFALAIQTATLAGRRAEALAAAQVIERGLMWYADAFGESRQTLKVLGELRWAGILPLSVWFVVDSQRREVHISRYRYVDHLPRAGPGSP